MAEDHTIDKVIGININRYRTMAGMTQKALGESCTPRLSSQQVSKYELGTDRISAAHVVEFSVVLKCTVADLMTGLEVPMIANGYTRGDNALMQNYQQLSPDAQEQVRALVNCMVKEAVA